MFTIAAALLLVSAVQQSDQQGQPAVSAPSPETSPAPSSNSSEIIVEAQRHLERKVIDTFVGQISQRSENQIARLHDSVCPVVVGLPDEYASYIVNRIKVVARQLKLRIARKSNCDANIVLILATDSAAFVNDVRSNHGGWLAGVASTDIDRLAKPGSPARAWSATSLRNEDGQPASGGVLIVKSASFIAEPTRQYIDASFIVIDQTATYGLTLRQIADYAAMRGLARTRETAAAGGVVSILSLFDRSTAIHPQGLSSTDMAYLRALYARTGEERAVQERARIARQIAKAQ